MNYSIVKSVIGNVINSNTSINMQRQQVKDRFMRNQLEILRKIYYPNKELPNNEMLNKEILNKELPNNETLNKELPKKESNNDEMLVEIPMDEITPTDELQTIEKILPIKKMHNKELPNNETLNKELPKKESNNDEMLVEIPMDEITPTDELQTIEKILPIKKMHNKLIYKPVIPLNIYQTWHTKNLPNSMKSAVNKIINTNPEFNYYLFDDDDCRNFIKLNFDARVLHAFDSLIPGAYKADLWRYCVLYKNGGIYLDIKYEPFNGFKFINLTENEHWVLDMDKIGIYNALMVCKPNNEILLKAINKVVDNVKNRFYGLSTLEPTGPLMLAQFFTQNDKNNFDMYHDIYISVVNRFIFFNGYIILKSYKTYLNEFNKTTKVSHYSNLWENRNIYK